jgi:hypothetical protein
MTGSAAFWSQAAARKAEANAAGSVPPVTNPKYDAPVLATVAGLPAPSSRRSTSFGSLP